MQVWDDCEGKKMKLHFSEISVPVDMIKFPFICWLELSSGGLVIQVTETFFFKRYSIR